MLILKVNIRRKQLNINNNQTPELLIIKRQRVSKRLMVDEKPYLLRILCRYLP